MDIGILDQEKPVIFNCHSKKLFGVVHLTSSPFKFGVLIVVGGPQYRVGSHRQFILLARYLAKNGVAVMRFDYRGMGDSEGEIRPFYSIDEDIKAAIDAFYISCHSLSGVIIWGLCDAASAALFYGYQDDRVRGLVLLNPWVFSEKNSAKVFLKHYYKNRLFSLSFWKKIFTLRFNYKDSVSSLLVVFFKVFNGFNSNSVVKPSQPSFPEKNSKVDKTLPLPRRMYQSLKNFHHPVLFILSGNDLTAKEFKELVGTDNQWEKLLKKERITQLEIDEADHTFSSVRWRNQVADITFDWVKRL